MEKPRYQHKKNDHFKKDRPYRGERPKRTSSAFAAMEQLEERETAGDAGLIEGRNAVWEALQSGRQLDKILLAQGAQNMGHILAAARAAGVAIQECDRRKLDKMTVTGSHQGIIALGAAAEYKTIEDILALAEKNAAAPKKPRIFTTWGAQDIFVDTNRAFPGQMAALGWDIQSKEVPDRMHNWTFFNEALKMGLHFCFD